MLSSPRSSLWCALALLAAGCQGQTGPAPAGKAVTGSAPADPGHTHERGKMLIADAGPHHALLTAHLSQKDGNELDILFETPDTKDPKPVALPVESVTAQATVGGGEPQVLRFEPAPENERPKDEKAGTCSHFVAKAPWMKPTDILYVVANVTIDGKPVTIRWSDFNPKKYAHHED
jgi:hypothetical protein